LKPIINPSISLLVGKILFNEITDTSNAEMIDSMPSLLMFQPTVEYNKLHGIPSKVAAGPLHAHSNCFRYGVLQQPQLN
jgi:hypothetical protein